MFKYLILFLLFNYSLSAEEFENKWEECYRGLDQQLNRYEESLYRLAKNEQDEWALNEINERDDKADSIGITNIINSLLGGLTGGGGDGGIGGLIPGIGGGSGLGLGKLLEGLLNAVAGLIGQLAGAVGGLPIKEGSNSDKVITNLAIDIAKTYIPFYKANQKFLSIIENYKNLSNN